MRPTNASLTLGCSHADVNADGVTRSVDLASKDTSIYPLSVLVSAALSTKADKATRGQMADFLDYVHGPGRSRATRSASSPPGTRR